MVRENIALGLTVAAVASVAAGGAAGLIAVGWGVSGSADVAMYAMAAAMWLLIFAAGVEGRRRV